MELTIIVVLLSYTIVREIMFAYQTNKLINKLMSRNYYDYKITEQSTKPVEDKIHQKIEDDEPEDMGVLEGIGALN